jgi:hypothetical protein
VINHKKSNIFFGKKESNHNRRIFYGLPQTIFPPTSPRQIAHTSGNPQKKGTNTRPVYAAAR